MNIPVILLGIDWSELRNQRNTLLAVIGNMVTDSSNDKSTNEQIIAERDDLQGILSLISSLQDYAVDELKIDPMHVYDFEAEEQQPETMEEKFARENAQIIFQISIEGETIYVDDEMSKEFMLGIVDDPMHASAIKNGIRIAILNDVMTVPDDFEKDEDGNFTYDSTMMDYGFVIEEYCREIYYAGKTKTLYLCGSCGSENVESHAMVNPNAPSENQELINLDDSSSNYCFDCEQKTRLIKSELKWNKEIIGYQVIHRGNGESYNVNPKAVYPLKQAQEFLSGNGVKLNFKLVTIWSGDIEDPVMK